MKTLINTGKLVDPIKGLTAEEITIESIASSLSKICRFNGHCNRFYSVAEHCYVSALWAIERYNDSRVALACLLHDAAEAYLGDIVTPLKVTLPQMNVLEGNILKTISKKYKVDIAVKWNDLLPEIKEIDKLMLAVERNLFMPPNPLWAIDMPMMPPKVRNHFFIGSKLIGEVQWQEAEQMFIVMALRLLKEVGEFG